MLCQLIGTHDSGGRGVGGRSMTLSVCGEEGVTWGEGGGEVVFPQHRVLCCARALLPALPANDTAMCISISNTCCARLHGLTIPWESGGAEIVTTFWRLMLSSGCGAPKQ